MKDSLVVGIENTMEHTVTDDMSPAHLPMKVLSTPSMIQLIEMTCLHCAQAHLDDGETTVGTHVNVSHQGKAMSGETVTIDVKLSEINKRRLTFDINVNAPSGLISTGTHQRAVLDLSRMGG
ncbi:MAG: thioesterase family protein [Candidatus Hydrogenedentota bacterium]